jgi:Tfp pilus assembly protein PilF
MSLLLDALKKAEKAKEDAKRRAQGDRDATVAAPQPPAPEPVRTRAELPELRPLEILGDEPAPKPVEPTLALTEEKPRAQPKAESPSAAQAQARKVFEAKFREPNPRLPFFITMGALGVFAIGTVIYFWIQLRPPAPIANLNPRPPVGEVPVAASAPAAFAAPSTQTAIPGLPSTPVATAPAPAKPAPRPVEREPERPLLTPQPRAAAPIARAPAQAEINATRAAPQVHPKVGTAYAAYLAGDLAAARADYQDALREEPANRDALLGVAALDVRGGRFEAAEAGYLRLLYANPRDAHAQAALIALRTGRVDPLAAESRVKSMLADNPGAHVLNFTLGNQLAQQGRWAEAQQEYFRAFAAEPNNPDFAYNLAVSLDHLRQPKLALEYYRRALSLAKARGASFDAGTAEARAAQLAR